MRKFLEIARTGLAAILLHRLRSVVTTAALVAVLLPYLVGLGISRGVQQDAELSVRAGADLYVTGMECGRVVPIPSSAAAEIRKKEGVTDAYPRIVGELVLKGYQERAVVVGIPREKMAASITCVDGRLPRDGGPNELVLGTELARRLKVKVGDPILPFYHNDQEGDRSSLVVGIFRSDVGLWEANLMFTTFKTASVLFSQQGRATDLLVSCRPGYQAQVSRAIVQTVSLSPPGEKGTVQPHVTAREELQALLPEGLMHREGIFTLHFVLAFAVGILVVLVTSGLGLSERRREIGILKATGWQTDEILLRSLVESFLLTLAGAALAIVLAFLWLKGFNGYWIAGIFLAGVDTQPGFRIPFRLLPVPVLLAFLIALVVVLTGTLYSSWRAATVPPREAMR